MSKHSNEMSHKGWRTCKVCGIGFPLVRGIHYIARETTTMGLSNIMSVKEPQLFDAFDCPHCGCQNIVGQRFRVVDDDDMDRPVCPYPKGGECYCKDICSPECEFHPEHKEAAD